MNQMKERIHENNMEEKSAPKQKKNRSILFKIVAIVLILLLMGGVSAGIATYSS